MSEEKNGQRKPSSSKNIRKLRAAGVVCSLTSSWQQWVSDNEKKQAGEPSGWAPPLLEEQAAKPKTWFPRKPPSTQTQKTSESLVAQTQNPQGSSNSGEVKNSSQPCVKTKQAVKTASLQEKGASIGPLTETMKMESLPSGEEIDKLLRRKSSPTRRRKCSNTVSSLTKGWKQMESEQRLSKDEGGPVEEHKRGAEQESRDAGSETSHVEDAQTRVTNISEDVNHSDEEAVRIKRPQVSAYKKDTEDANKINAFSKKYSAVGNLKSRWQNWAVEHTVNQKLNPFSEYFDYDYSMSLRLQKGQEGYGRPKEGTKTAERAKRAEQHIHREIDDMCYVIRTMAEPDPDGKTRVTFGQLFDRYVRISDKVVGILMRARKHGKVAFEGEMLWQGQDDGVIITLLV
uniref:Actin-binding Rho-activating protein n=1 Tax=Oryzias latipes TaxID=8090 RepID=A0A3P9M2W4_ORYLA